MASIGKAPKGTASVSKASMVNASIAEVMEPCFQINEKSSEEMSVALSEESMRREQSFPIRVDDLDEVEE